MRLRTRQYLLIGALLMIWLTISACSCSGLLRGATRLGREYISPTATPARDRPAEERVSTPLPSPTATSPSEKTAVPLLPETPDESFDIRFTEQELNEYLAGQALEQEGVAISDMNATIDTERISVTFRVAHEGSGIRGGVVVHAVPKVEDGQLYVEIRDFALDDSISGFSRIVANSLIKAAIESYETDQGIPIPVTDLEFEAVQLMPGAIRVTGRPR